MKNPTMGKTKRVSSEEVITSFYGLDGAAAAIKASNFDIMEEITMVIQHTRDPDPKVSLPALRHFRGLMKELVLSNGMIGTVRQTETLEDTNISRTMSSSTLLTNLRSQNGQIKNQEETQGKHEILRAQNGDKGDTTLKSDVRTSNTLTSNNDDDGVSTSSRTSDSGSGNP